MRNVLSLFDGKSCGQMALRENGQTFDTYYASEIKESAIKVTQLNFPNTVQLGDITRWREWDIDWARVDLILAGSPCQGFSFAGKQLNFEDPRSQLFFVFVDILTHVQNVNPNVKFLLENVKMFYEFESVITKILKLFPVELNSKLVSAQDRKRLYWSNIRVKYDDFFKLNATDIPVPKDLGLSLADVLNLNNPHDVVDLTQSARIKTMGETSRGIRPIGKYERRGSLGEFGTIVYVTEKSPTITRTHRPCVLLEKHETDLRKSKVIRLNVDEIIKLQTVPDWVEWGDLSDNMKLDLLGDGWTVKMIQHILSYYE